MQESICTVTDSCSYFYSYAWVNEEINKKKNYWNLEEEKIIQNNIKKGDFRVRDTTNPIWPKKNGSPWAELPCSFSFPLIWCWASSLVICNWKSKGTRTHWYIPYKSSSRIAEQGEKGWRMNLEKTEDSQHSKCLILPWIIK